MIVGEVTRKQGVGVVTLYYNQIATTWKWNVTVSSTTAPALHFLEETTRLEKEQDDPEWPTWYISYHMDRAC